MKGVIEGFRLGATEGYIAGRNDEKNDALAYIKPCLEKGPCAGVPLASMIRPETESSWTEISAGADKVAGRLKLQKYFGPRYRAPDGQVLLRLSEHASMYDCCGSRIYFFLNGKASSEQELAFERTGCNP